jgi:hypothetical protein
MNLMESQNEVSGWNKCMDDLELGCISASFDQILRTKQRCHTGLEYTIQILSYGIRKPM